jgi:hypothetical protein
VILIVYGSLALNVFNLDVGWLLASAGLAGLALARGA